MVIIATLKELIIVLCLSWGPWGFSNTSGYGKFVIVIIIIIIFDHLILDLFLFTCIRLTF